MLDFIITFIKKLFGISSKNAVEECELDATINSSITDINAKTIEDEYEDNFEVMLCNLFKGYDIIDIKVNGNALQEIIKENELLLYKINSKFPVTKIEIDCSIFCEDGSDETIRNLHGEKDITGHSSVVTVNINDVFLNLTPITFNAYTEQEYENEY